MEQCRRINCRHHMMLANQGISWCELNCQLFVEKMCHACNQYESLPTYTITTATTYKIDSNNPITWNNTTGRFE